jgi:hypothetical protein
MRTLKQHQVRTGRQADEKKAMRLPHERDESDEQPETEVREDMKQAFDDISEGQVDTDLRATGGLDSVVNERPGTPPEKVIKKGAK